MLDKTKLNLIKGRKILITGAGGFIGGYLTKFFYEQGFEVLAVDIKPISKWYQKFSVKNISTDLSDLSQCIKVTKNIDIVFNLAADMGGMGFIENNKARCMLSVLINTHLLQASRFNGVQKYFFASSACVYDANKQITEFNSGLHESDAYPANPEDGYGWEKLFSERMCRHFKEDFGIETHVARFHNVYGPFGTFEGGREKVPAAICRKVINAKLNSLPDIEIWGDGKQTRSFTYVDDAIFGIVNLVLSEVSDPINIGSSKLYSINELVDIVESIAGVKLERRYNLEAPKGVRGRNSNNDMILNTLNWEPKIDLPQGIKKTYDWIYENIKQS